MISENVDLRPMSESDLEACQRLESQVSPNPWPLSTFRRGIQKNHWSRVAKDKDREIVGFCICQLVADELSVLNIAVSADLQRQGLGRRLMTEALQGGVELGATVAFLEVRQSNLGAQALYERLGFHVAGIRENYYPGRTGSREHALIMARALLDD